MARYDERFWAVEAMWHLVARDPEGAWIILLELIGRAEGDRALAYIAAGPLENFLVAYGEGFLPRVEAEAARNARFRRALVGVWGENRMSEDLVRRDFPVLSTNPQCGPPLTAAGLSEKLPASSNAGSMIQFSARSMNHQRMPQERERPSSDVDISVVPQGVPRRGHHRPDGGADRLQHSNVAKGHSPESVQQRRGRDTGTGHSVSRKHRDIRNSFCRNDYHLYTSSKRCVRLWGISIRGRRDPHPSTRDRLDG